MSHQTLVLIAELNLRPEDLEVAQVRLPPYGAKLVGTPFLMGETPVSTPSLVPSIV